MVIMIATFIMDMIYLLLDPHHLSSREDNRHERIFKYVNATWVRWTGLLLFYRFTTIGRLFITETQAYEQSIAINQPPSSEHWLGTDSQGRDLFAMMVLGSGMTLQIGAIAGAIGLGLGIVLGFVSGYFGGLLDTIITSLIDIWMTIPAFLILIMVAIALGNIDLGVTQMGLIIAIVSGRPGTPSLAGIDHASVPSDGGQTGGWAAELVMKELVPACCLSW
jgi:ABC-type dipeptide/oligopeptide/nickel transport system permease subunit